MGRLQVKHSQAEKNRFPAFRERFRELQGTQSNTDFAEFLGMSRQTVGFYCNGDRIPDALILRDIADRCGVSVDWLLGRPDSAKTIGADIAAVKKYTGLSETAIELLHSIHDQEKQVDTISAIISHGAFSSIVSYALELKDAKIESELERWGTPGQETEKIPGGGRIVRGFEHEIFLEYMIETCIKTIVGEITQDMIDKEYPIE